MDAPKEVGELNVPEGEDLQSDAPQEGGEDLDIAEEDLQLDVPKKKKEIAMILSWMHKKKVAG